MNKPEYDIDNLSDDELVVLKEAEKIHPAGIKTYDPVVNVALKVLVQRQFMERVQPFTYRITESGRGYLRTLEQPAEAAPVDVDWIHIIVEQVRDKCKELLSVDDQIDTAWVLAKMDEIVEELTGE